MKLTNDGEETVRITTGLLQSFGIYAELPAARQKMILPGRVNPYPRQNMPKTPHKSRCGIVPFEGRFPYIYNDTRCFSMATTLSIPSTLTHS